MRKTDKSGGSSSEMMMMSYIIWSAQCYSDSGIVLPVGGPHLLQQRQRLQSHCVAGQVHQTMQRMRLGLQRLARPLAQEGLTPPHASQDAAHQAGVHFSLGEGNYKQY